MSRIDKALTAWESKTSPASIPRQADESNGATPRFELGKYEREVSTAPAEIPAAPPAASAAAHLPPSQPLIRTSLNPDVEARLVTGGSGAVPLEQYRRLAAILHDIQLQQGLKTLMLTSALPAEGKTLTTVNLALTLSESYARRVLIIDADLRWPSIHKLFGVPNRSGLTDVLQGSALEPPVQRLSDGLAILTAGSPGKAPLADLTSSRMAELIEWCGQRFDWVLLDTPPVGLLPDAQLLARLTRAVVFVIAAGSTPSAAVQRAIAELGADCVIGTVLNRVDDRRIPEAGYYSRYGYGYGEADETE